MRRARWTCRWCRVICRRKVPETILADARRGQSYEQGASWKEGRDRKGIGDLLYEKGIVVLTWICRRGGVASRTRPIVERKSRG